MNKVGASLLLSSCLLVLGCGQSAPSALVRSEVVAPGAECPAGGTRLSFGVDADRSGALEGEEVSTSTFVCNGEAGAAGSRGETGSPGSPGAAAVNPTVTPVSSAGDAGNCVGTGGVKVQMGNGPATYVCNGASGTTGASGETGAAGESATVTPVSSAGEAGNCVGTGGVKVQVGNGPAVYACNGEAGAQGNDGPSGFNSLIFMNDEPVGLNCPAGGLRLDVGLDDGEGGGVERDGTLQSGEIDQTRYICGTYAPVFRSFAVPPTSAHTVDVTVGTPWTGEVPMSVAWDGTNYWFATGTDRQGGRLIKTDASFNHVASYGDPGDTGNYRSVTTQVDGVPPLLVTRAWDESISSVSESNGAITLTPVSRLDTSPGVCYSRDPALSWDPSTSEWIGRTGDTYHRFDTSFGYLGAFVFTNDPINSSLPVSIVAHKGRILAYMNDTNSLAVFSRDGVKLEELALPDGPDVAFGMSIANGKLWLADFTSSPMSFKAYDVLE
ncbi:MAG: hypothetical protein RL653_2934 [Pseudomonadota bacterium]